MFIKKCQRFVVKKLLSNRKCAIREILLFYADKFTFKNPNIQKKQRNWKNFCFCELYRINFSLFLQCVLFGTFMIWFASITINLGPTFLSGALAANTESGHNAPSCPLIHGPFRHYILNALWIVINIICVALTLFHLRKLHRDLTKANVEAVSGNIKHIYNQSLSNVYFINSYLCKEKNIKLHMIKKKSFYFYF